MQIEITKAKMIKSYNLNNNTIDTDDDIDNHINDNGVNGWIIMRIKIKK